jgi:hypothetical protein
MTIDPNSEHAYTLHSLRAFARCSCGAHAPRTAASRVRRVVGAREPRSSLIERRLDAVACLEPGVPVPREMCVPDLIIRYTRPTCILTWKRVRTHIKTPSHGHVI